MYIVHVFERYTKDLCFMECDKLGCFVFGNVSRGPEIAITKISSVRVLRYGFFVSKKVDIT